MARRSTVWMVHSRTSLEGVKGTLSLEDRALIFTPEGGRSAETVLPLASITRTHRPRASPVLEVAVDLPNAPPLIGFYFIEPPPLARGGSAIRFLERVLTKRKAVLAIQMGNAVKHEEVDRWVKAIQDAQSKD
jgi:hypothetical protein